MAKVEVYPEETEIEDVQNLSLVRLRLITHNARLVDARKEHGINGDPMAQAVGISRDRLRNIETLRAIPNEDEMIKIACILEKPIDYLFPEELMSAVTTGVFSRRKVELAAPEIISLTEAQSLRLTYDGETSLIEEVTKAQLTEDIKEVLLTLEPREAHLLELRFGLNNGRSHTLEEVGKAFNLSRARIHEIESRALRKLRHPSRARRLKDYLE